MSRVRIDRRFCGPPDSGNGGYACGLVAAAIGGSDCRVTLLKPPPLDRDLLLDSDGDTARLLDGEGVIATAERHQPAIDVPAPPTLAAAEKAEARYVGLRHHHFPGCFVCGPDRAAGDGLRLFPGKLGNGGGQVACRWTPDASLLDPDGFVRAEFVWAALDCPGYWAVSASAGLAVLGRLAVELHVARVPAGLLIVTGWPNASEGRKHRAGTALHDADGCLLAAADATWITLDRRSG